RVPDGKRDLCCRAAELARAEAHSASISGAGRGGPRGSTSQAILLTCPFLPFTSHTLAEAPNEGLPDAGGHSAPAGRRDCPARTANFGAVERQVPAGRAGQPQRSFALACPAGRFSHGRGHRSRTGAGATLRLPGTDARSDP